MWTCNSLEGLRSIASPGNSVQRLSAALDALCRSGQSGPFSWTNLVDQIRANYLGGQPPARVRRSLNQLGEALGVGAPYADTEPGELTPYIINAVRATMTQGAAPATPSQPAPPVDQTFADAGSTVPEVVSTPEGERTRYVPRNWNEPQPDYYNPPPEDLGPAPQPDAGPGYSTGPNPYGPIPEGLNPHLPPEYYEPGPYSGEPSPHGPAPVPLPAPTSPPVPQAPPPNPAPRQISSPDTSGPPAMPEVIPEPMGAPPALPSYEEPSMYDPTTPGGGMASVSIFNPGSWGVPQGDCMLADWAQQMNGAQAAAMARADPEIGNVATQIGRILQPANNRGAMWAWRQGTSGDWKVHLKKLGRLQLTQCYDPDVAGGVDTTQVFNLTGTTTTGTPVAPSTNGTSSHGSGDLLSLVGEPPIVIQKRKCQRKDYVLATNGLCYHKKVLPRDLRLSKPYKPLLSYGEGKAIRDGMRASKRIDRLDKKLEREYRKLAPARRRS